MDLATARANHREKARIENLFELMPDGFQTALGAGARDGYLSVLLAQRGASVTALDLYPPRLDHPSITCVKGNICALEYPDDTFDLVLCTEVLEHIPPALLSKACSELARVSRKYLVIGV